MTAVDFVEMPWTGPIGDPDPIEGNGASLADLSRRRRLGLKGRNTLAWLEKKVQPVPERNNTARTSGGVLVIRLAPTEAVLLAVGEGGGGLLKDLRNAHERESPEGCYNVPRQDMSVWFRISGETSPAVMAEICAIDFRVARFANGMVAQTSVAHQNAIVTRDDRKDVCGFDLLTDYASGEYFWKVLAGKVGSQ